MTNYEKAWPYAKCNGDSAKWEEHKTDRLAFLIGKSYLDLVQNPRSRTIPRVTADYTVTADDDLHGPRGTMVKMETPEQYEKRCSADERDLMKCWGKSIAGYGGAARRVANKAHKEKPYDPTHLFACVDKEFGTKTDKATTTMVKTFIGMEKKNTTKIADFNREWLDGVEHLRSSEMELPPNFLVSLYLISLGPKYKAVEATAAVLTATERTLEKVMSMAIDVNDDDEADNSDMALLAEVRKRGLIPRNKRHYEAAFAADDTNNCPPLRCTNCGGRWHVAAACFSKGGGLSHLDAKQRRAHLEKKRREKEEHRYGNRGYRREENDKTTTDVEQASLVLDLQSKLNEQATTIETQDKKMKRATDRLENVYGVDADLQFEQDI